MIITKENFGQVLSDLLSKTILDYSFINLNEVEIYENVLEDFMSDFNEYFPLEDQIDQFKMQENIPLYSILCYRLARRYYIDNQEDVAYVFSNLGRIITGIELYHSSSIGKGLKINHGIGTVVGSKSKIGNNVLLHHNITIGGKNGGSPTIEDNVIIYPGCCIIGKITVGNNSIIGAHSVVIKDIPSFKIVAGNPAKIIKKNGT